MLVKEIMTTNVRTAHPDTLIREVAVTMCFNKISGMPVVDANNKVIGIISEKDILNAMYPDVKEIMENGLVSLESLEREYRDVVNNRVQTVMKGHVVTAKPDDPILRAVSVMCARRIRRIPVADNDGKLVGIVSMGDAHKAIFQSNLMESEDSGARAAHG
jgi:CBS domain-containing protein